MRKPPPSSTMNGRFGGTTRHRSAPQTLRGSAHWETGEKGRDRKGGALLRAATNAAGGSNPPNGPIPARRPWFVRLPDRRSRGAVPSIAGELLAQVRARCRRDLMVGTVS